MSPVKITAAHQSDYCKTTQMLGKCLPQQEPRGLHKLKKELIKRKGKTK